MGYISRDTSPIIGRSISRNVAHLNILVHDMKTYCIIIEINIEMKTTTTAVIKKELKCFLMSGKYQYSRARHRGITLNMVHNMLV